MTIRSKAPLRVSFCGGGTDVSPYPEERGGCVLSTTIDHYAYASVTAREDERIAITSLFLSSPRGKRSAETFLYYGLLRNLHCPS